MDWETSFLLNKPMQVDLATSFYVTEPLKIFSMIKCKDSH